MTTAFPRWEGDTLGSFVFEAARAIRERGVRVRVVAMYDPGAKRSEVLAPDIEVHRARYLWPERLQVLQSAAGGLPGIWRKSRLARLALIPFFMAHTIALTRYARDCELIHANWTLSAASAWLAGIYLRRPYVVTVQGSDIFQAAQLPLARSITRIVLNRARRVIALSRSLKEATVALGVEPEHIEIIPNGVDTNRFQPSSQERKSIVLFVGWLIERKGVRFLIEAMAMVRQRSIEHRLVIVGVGPQKEMLMQMAKRLRIDHHVEFVGHQTQQQVGQWMREAKLLVLPSLEEGLGVVLLEALACGTPCVASRVGGIPEVVTPDVGRLVEPGDASGLAKAIVAVLEDGDEWTRLSQNARARAEARFSWQTISSRLLDVYQSIGK